MKRHEAMVLGANHQFLYPQAMSDAQIHGQTLAILVRDARIEAVDCWVWPHEPYRSREIELLKGCGKVINYNIGDRAGDEVAVYAAPQGAGGEYAWDILRRELDMALACGSRKIIMGSGPDFPEDREGAKARLVDFCAKACAYVGGDVMLTIEPTDRDVDKRFLLGPISESVRVIEAVRKRGHSNFGMLLDMGHIPILHDTIAHAVQTAKGTIEHIHLGNALISDKAHPFYGDKHVPWCMEGCEYYQPDINEMIRALWDAGYFGPGRRPTVTFEMRVCEGKTAEESLGWFIERLDEAWDALEAE